jgi:hypothetical protein
MNSPVFIIGTGRCGSTMLHDTLAYHPELSWLTQIVNKYPHKPKWNVMALKAMDIKPLFPILRKKLRADEPYFFFERYFKGFSRPHRDLLATDIRHNAAKKFKESLNEATRDGADLIVKYTGWPRIGLLKAMYPDAKFIHIVRDGRAVVNSVLEAGYFDGWAGPASWARGELTQEQEQLWRDSGESFVVLAAMGWVNRMNAFKKASEGLTEEEYLEIKYEDICKQPEQNMQNILHFMGLKEHQNTEFFERFKQLKFRDSNTKWKENFTEEQQGKLCTYLAPYLQEWGYN